MRKKKVVSLVPRLLFWSSPTAVVFGIAFVVVDPV
jgi:hypothetical protein